MYKSLIFDFESMDNKPSTVVLDLSAVLFNEDDTDSFADLIIDRPRTFSVKFDVKSQEGRTVGKETLDWWVNQPEEVQEAALLPSDKDVSLKEGILRFKAFLEHNKFDFRYGRAYVRGSSFDFPVMSDIVDKLFNSFDMGYSMFPVAFWNQSDIRTLARWCIGDIESRKSIVPKGSLEGFIKHNSLHDCCKEVVVIQTAYKIANNKIDDGYEFELI